MKKEVTFEFEAEDFEADVVAAIQDLAATIGWCIAYRDDDEGLDHLIVGTEGAIEEIDRAFEVYTVLVPEPEDGEWRH